MVTTSQIPEEANEPPEPHPHQETNSAPTARTNSGPIAGLHNGGPLGYSTPPAVSEKEAIRQALDPEKVWNGPNASSSPIAFDYAASSGQSKYSPNGTTTVVSEEDPNEKASSAYHGVDPHFFAATEVAKYLRVNPEDGLTSQESQERLARDGPNKLEGDEGVGMWRVLVRQVSNSLTLVS